MYNRISKHRRAAFKKQSGRCYYCGVLMWEEDQKGFAEEHGITKKAAVRFQCTAEHLLARCEGGKNTRDNIVAACRFCNKTRHQRKKPPEPINYRKQIQKKLKSGKC